MNPPFPHRSSPTTSDLARAFALAAAWCTTTAAQEPPADDRVDGARLTLGEAVDRALRTVDDGVAWRAGIDLGNGALVYTVDVARDGRTIGVEIDAATGEVLRRLSRREDRAALVAANKTSLTFAIEAVERHIGGTAIEATMRWQNGDPVVVVRTLEPQHDAVNEVRLDGRTGRILRGADAIAEDAPRLHTRPEPTDRTGRTGGYTDTFLVSRRELRSSGRNPFFALEPGHVLRLAGDRGGSQVGLVVRVLEETRRVDGVETRVVERREEVDGQPTLVVRSYCAISARTNDVYCLGEDVVRYEDGRPVGSGFAWRSGRDGARFGLAMPATPLAGARFCRTIASGVAMDRAEITSIGGTLTTPAGRFEDVVELTTTSSSGAGRSRSWYAPGVASSARTGCGSDAWSGRTTIGRAAGRDAERRRDGRGSDRAAARSPVVATFLVAGAALRVTIRFAAGAALGTPAVAQFGDRLEVVLEAVAQDRESRAPTRVLAGFRAVWMTGVASTLARAGREQPVDGADIAVGVEPLAMDPAARCAPGAEGFGTGVQGEHRVVPGPLVHAPASTSRGPWLARPSGSSPDGLPCRGHFLPVDATPIGTDSQPATPGFAPRASRPALMLRVNDFRQFLLSVVDASTDNSYFRCMSNDNPSQQSMSDHTERSFRTELPIAAPREAVWSALTEAREIERWFAPDCSVEARPGGTMVWAWDDQCRWQHTIEVIEPGQHLRTRYDSAVPDPAGGGRRPLFVDFHLEGDRGVTRLRVVHSGFGPEASFDAEFDGISQGWPVELRSLRLYLERHRGQDRHVAWERRSTDAAPADVWRRLLGPDGLQAPDLGSRTEGEPFAVRLGEVGRIEGATLFVPGPREFSGVVGSLGDAWLRVHCEHWSGATQVWLWLALYGRHGERADAVRSAFAGILDRCVPAAAAPEPRA